MTVTFLKAFGRITIQDQGRPGQRAAGLPLGGPADRASGILANRLVGNADLAPLLEFGLATATFSVDGPCVLAWTGARATLHIDGVALAPDRTVACATGAIITVADFAEGRYGYLAIGGQWAVERWRGSTSPVLLGAAFRPAGSVIQKGQRVLVHSVITTLQVVSSQPTPAVSGPSQIGFYPGPEADLFAEWLGREGPAGTGQRLVHMDYTVAPQSDRVGIRLRHALDAAELPTFPDLEIRSSPTLPGTVQVLPGGHLIVSLVDGPTMGGYPRIGLVVEEDLWRLAQARGRVRFVEA